jgi:precorrin-6B methylase 2
MVILSLSLRYKNFLRSSNTLTKEDAFTWLRERYLSKRLFMGSGKQQVLDKIKDKVRKINRVLMDVIQPPELKKKYFNEVKSQNPNMTMVELNRQIKNNKMNDRLLDFESTI